MRAVIASALIAASVLAPIAASAKTYEEVAASGVVPVDADAMLDCSFYWDAWAQSLNPDYYGKDSGIWDPSWLATLNPAILLPAAKETGEYWMARAKAEYKAKKQSKKFDERMANAPKYNVEALDERKFMELLGECARPKKG